jgi:hypothetical protein
VPRSELSICYKTGIEMSKSILPKDRSARARFGSILTLVGFGLVCATVTACSLNRPVDTTQPMGYTSQKRIVRQGYARVWTPHGERAAVFLGYDRNRDMQTGGRWSTRRGVDLVEYKYLNDAGGWDYIPFLLVVDDNFDGVVERILVDRDPPAGVDAVYDVQDLEMSIDRIDLHVLRPFR